MIVLAALTTTLFMSAGGSLDQAKISQFRARDRDWRIGPVVYQVLVDRFAPSSNLKSKQALYADPRTLKTWSELPAPGIQLDIGVWSHELEFWGGDLPSLRQKLGHVASLADVLYLNPIHDALTNHKYDATHYDKIAPEYGTWDDFVGLLEDSHKSRLKVVLDGVFNHCGKSNPIFQDAIANSKSPYRDWFTLGKEYTGGYRAWANVPNLPEIHLETKAVREYLWLSDDSIVAKYLKAGADGWRLDVAHEIGYEYLGELTKAAHRHKPGSLVLGEAWNYPADWLTKMDGILGVFLGNVICDAAQGNLTGRQLGRSLQGVVEDCGIEPLLRSWIVLANHDMPRLANRLPDGQQRKLAQILQFSLPGSPLIYYGDEIGMKGGGDPAQRGPMQWNLVTDANDDFVWQKKLVSLRRANRGLRLGDFRSLETERLFAFLRTTDRVLDTTLVIANPLNEPVTESMVVPEPRLMGWTLMKDELSDFSERIIGGTIRVTLPAKTAVILTIEKSKSNLSQYKRMKDGQ